MYREGTNLLLYVQELKVQAFVPWNGVEELGGASRHQTGTCSLVPTAQASTPGFSTSRPCGLGTPPCHGSSSGQ